MNKLEKNTYSKEPGSELWYKLIVAPGFRYTRHAIVWLALAFIILQSPNEPEFRDPVNMVLTSAFVIYLLGYLYLNVYYLVPKYLLKRRFYKYLLMVFYLAVGTFIVLCLVDELLNPYRLTPKPPDKDLGLGKLLTAFVEFLILFGITIAASAAVKLFQHWVRSLEHFYSLEKINFQLEIDQLKNQINPHFLFNTLNNVHILIDKQPQVASRMLLNLSDLLQYQIYDCSEDKVLLSADLQFLNDFLELEASRRDEFSFSIKRTGDPRDVQIPAFLFIPFVENAIKHNFDAEEPSFMMASFNLKMNELKFTCINSKPHIKILSPGKKNGIGLANIRRRLSLLYPDSHELKIEETATTFNVYLLIKL